MRWQRADQEYDRNNQTYGENRVHGKPKNRIHSMFENPPRRNRRQWEREAPRQTRVVRLSEDLVLVHEAAAAVPVSHLFLPQLFHAGARPLEAAAVVRGRANALLVLLLLLVDLELLLEELATVHARVQAAQL